MATSHDAEMVELAHNLTGFQRDMLAAVREAPARQGSMTYGLAVKRQLEAWTGESQGHGRIYPNLDTLVQNGLVRKEELDKRTNGYALTAGGENVLEVLAECYEETDG